MLEKKIQQTLQALCKADTNSLMKMVAQHLLNDNDSTELLSDTVRVDALLRYDTDEEELEALYEEHHEAIADLKKRYPQHLESLLTYSPDPVQSEVWRALQMTQEEIKASIRTEL